MVVPLTLEDYCRKPKAVEPPVDMTDFYVDDYDVEDDDDEADDDDEDAEDGDDSGNGES